jgi:hypothetical protein
MVSFETTIKKKTFIKILMMKFDFLDFFKPRKKTKINKIYG